MSQSDSFIDEVTEEVRRDKLFATFKKYGWIAILLVLVIVGAAAWNEYRRAKETAAAEAFGDAMLAALEQGEPAERATALGAIDTESPEGRAVLDLIQAAELINAGDTAAAVALLNGVADNARSYGGHCPPTGIGGHSPTDICSTGGRCPPYTSARRRQRNG